MASSSRLDQRLVELRLARSRTKARALIESGVVRVDGTRTTKPATNVDTAVTIEVEADPCPYVSRAALKLRHAIETFDVDPTGATALDLGASTGGFVEVLLEHGAAQVYAVDVGHGQLDTAIADDPRVTSLEGVNSKSLTREIIPTAPNWITSDLSFISLEKALPAALRLATPDATLVALVKPQFEVGPENIGKGGLVRDEALRLAVVDRIGQWLAELGWTVRGTADSPIAGGDGNIEYLIWAEQCKAKT